MTTGIYSDTGVLADKNLIVSRNRGYSDLDLRLKKHPKHDDILPLKDIEAIKQSVKNLILTSKRERLFQPWLGSGVRDLLFEPADNITLGSIKQEIYRVIEKYEPRVNLTYVDIDNRDDINSLFVTIHFNIVNLEEEIAIEFYLERVR